MPLLHFQYIKMKCVVPEGLSAKLMHAICVFTGVKEEGLFETGSVCVSISSLT